MICRVRNSPVSGLLLVHWPKLSLVPQSLPWGQHRLPICFINICARLNEDWYFDLKNAQNALNSHCWEDPALSLNMYIIVNSKFTNSLFYWKYIQFFNLYKRKHWILLFLVLNHWDRNGLNTATAYSQSLSPHHTDSR